jgi:hypothetical protein
MKLRKTLKPSRPGKKNQKKPKNPKKPKKKPKKPTGLGFFLKNPGFFQPCIKLKGSVRQPLQSATPPH